jgi:very-short-patch-repair endonuclease
VDDQLVRAIDRIGRRQHALLTRQQANAVLGHDRVKRWMQDGRLEMIQPRVLRIAGSTRSAHQDMQAASLSAAGPTSHRSAAWMWGLIDRPEVTDVSVLYPRRVQLWQPAVAHRIRDLSDGCTLHRQGLLLTSPMRTIVDLGLVEPWWVVDGALGQAISSKLVPLRAVVLLREELARRGRNGTGVVQRVFDERLVRGADEDSTLELRLLRIVRRFGLPPITFQHEVWHEGRFVARPDAAYPDRMIAIEADGFASHSSPEAFQSDRVRQNELVVLGWTMLRFTYHDIVRRQSHVAEVIHSVL